MISFHASIAVAGVVGPLASITLSIQSLTTTKAFAQGFFRFFALLECYIRGVIDIGRVDELGVWLWDRHDGIIFH